MESTDIAANAAALISALEAAPGVIIPLIREVPEAILRRRPSAGKWSAYEHAIHLSRSDVAFRARLDLILSTPEPFIEVIENSAEDEAGAMLDVDLDASLERYVRERISLVERLKKLSPDEWQKTAVHEAFDHYSVFIMFRHVLNHEMLHAYRIEELLLKKDWEKP
ncbi:MAG: DinB family protein [Acidobacteria bacterium]|nr:DinB family protein [Acidobacteriota bacterium]